MECYLELDLWDNVMDGVYSDNHKFVIIAYMQYCNILSSSHIILSLKSHGVYYLFSNKSYNNNVEFIFEFTNLP